MNGTPKQITWAEQIREEYRKLRPQHDVSAEAGQILDTVLNCEDASFWIFCKTQRKDGLRSIATAYHDRVAKLAKTGIDVREILMADEVK